MATRRPGTGAIPLDELRVTPTTSTPSVPSGAPVASSRPGTGAIALDDVRAAAAAAAPGEQVDAWDVSAPTEAIPLPDADDGEVARKAFDEAAPTEILTLPPSREDKG